MVFFFFKEKEIQHIKTLWQINSSVRTIKNCSFMSNGFLLGFVSRVGSRIRPRTEDSESEPGPT